MEQTRVSKKTGLPLGGQPWGQLKARAVAMSVKPQTEKQYHMTVDRIYEFAQEYGFGHITEEAFGNTWSR
jgi:hypothetical protein